MNKMKKTLITLTALVFVFSVLAVPAFARKQKKQLTLPEDTQMAAVDWFKFQIEAYEPSNDNAFGIVTAEDHEEILRDETPLYNGIVYIMIRKNRVYRMLSLKNGKLALDRDGKLYVKDLTIKKFIQAGRYISEEVGHDIEKAYKDHNNVWIKTYIEDDEQQFRMFIVM